MAIQALDRALDILILLSENNHEMGISEIAREMDIHKSTVHRTLLTLEEKGFVEQNPENEKYWLGLRLYSIGMSFDANLSIKSIIRPFAQELYDEFHEVVNVSTLEHTDPRHPKSVIILKAEDPGQVLRANPPVGSSSECHCSSVGKCLLAFSSSMDFDQYQQTPLAHHTTNTITHWPAFLDTLEQVRENGYAVDNEELEIGLTCIGAPILNRSGTAIAAISLSGPTQRMRSGDFQYKIQRVKTIAARISEAIR
ncbi:IclR family transcriptional regulator [Bacilliculturomica massiliensis]|uniref:IclR family transcriptional regulator n=1 Tax=Bacilliculturomica massiliensis TaxID=1917867 RepID=UPI00102F8556|nr:IclR family transcriptional regulator [Bacilliculturomica massiliensis]